MTHFVKLDFQKRKLREMSEYEIPCLQFDMTREPGESWGLKIAGGIDQDASQNQFCPGDSGIFIISLDPNGLAAQFGEYEAILMVGCQREFRTRSWR